MRIPRTWMLVLIAFVAPQVGAPAPGAASVPPEWTCDPDFYGTDDGCDCGCGALDPDCSDATVGSCEYCGEDGACDAGSEDCSTVSPTQNWLCAAPQAPAPAMSIPALVLVALLLSGVGVLGLPRRRMRSSGTFK